MNLEVMYIFHPFIHHSLHRKLSKDWDKLRIETWISGSALWWPRIGCPGWIARCLRVGLQYNAASQVPRTIILASMPMPSQPNHIRLNHQFGHHNEVMKKFPECRMKSMWRMNGGAALATPPAMLIAHGLSTDTEIYTTTSMLQVSYYSSFKLTARFKRHPTRRLSMLLSWRYIILPLGAYLSSNPKTR